MMVMGSYMRDSRFDIRRHTSMQPKTSCTGPRLDRPTRVHAFQRVTPETRHIVCLFGVQSRTGHESRPRIEEITGVIFVWTT